MTVKRSRIVAACAATIFALLILAGCSSPSPSATSSPHPVSQSGQQSQQPQPAPQNRQVQPPSEGATGRSDDTFVEYKGRRYTCQEALNLQEPCVPATQQAFNNYGGGLPRYVNSGQLGVLSNPQYTFDQAALVGIYTCRYVDQLQGGEPNANELAQSIFEVDSSGYAGLTAADLTPAVSHAFDDDGLCPPRS